MANNEKQSSDSKTNILSKGLITDLHENFMGEEVWSYARNAVTNSHNGQVQFIQNEPSNHECVTFPYTPIGFVKVLGSRWVVFLTDNVNSEIGIFDEALCTYTRLINSSCLNFSIKSLIQAKFRERINCAETIYWTDGRNPRRFLNLANIPKQYSVEPDDVCKTKIYTDKLDCEGILIDKNITVPCIKVERGASGDLRNGAYEFAIAYTMSKQRITDYYSVTAPHKIWSHANHGYSLNLTISNIDRDFDEYELIAIITRQGGAREYKRIGYYGTGTSVVSVSSVDRPEFTSISIEEILIPRPKYPFADNIESNDQYLLWSGVTSIGELNYQKQAMKIIPKYVIYQLPADYYKKGGQLAGYMRDEVYTFAIQWLFKNGQWSSAFHIPGPAAKSSDTGLAAGRDVFEVVTGTTSIIKTWQVENTAGSPQTRSLPAGTDTGIIAEGDMAYWESTEHYGDSEALYEDSKCTPIRFIKFPDECKAPRYKPGGLYIYPLGVKFENVEHPKDSDGKYIEDVVGYRIVRGDRQGNESIIANGVFTNVRSYTEENGQPMLYSNYPYNDLRADSYLSTSATYNKNGEKGYVPLTGYSKNEFSFYSPETMFNRTSLGEEIRIYSEENAVVKGFFEEVYKHPRAKLLTEFDLYFALIIGALDGYYATKGKTCETKIGPMKESFTFGAGIPTPSGPSTPTTGTINANQNTMVTACDDALAFTSSLTANPKRLKLAERVLRSLAQAGVFAYFAIQTAQKVLDIILNSSGWQQYALQYNSHAFFTTRTCATKDYRRRRIDYYQYISDGLNTVNDKIFNNYKREECVYLKLNDELLVPRKTDTTRGTVGDFNICGNYKTPVTSDASLYYGGIKRALPSQYGQLENIQYFDTGSCVSALPLFEDGHDRIYQTDVIFGGDTYITRMTVKRSQNMFSEVLHDVLDEFIHDYSLYRNIGHPRYWIDTTPYDVSEAVSLSPKRSRTPRNKHNLNCDGNSGLNSVTVIKNKYFYTTNNGVLDFFTESTYNMEYRDWKNDYQNFYSSSNSDLTGLFRADRIEQREEFVYDSSYFKSLEENPILAQRVDYDPTIALTCTAETYAKNRVIYSLPAFEEQKGDGWLTYLASNFTDFPVGEFGNLTAMKGIDNQRIMFLFDKSAPYVTPGRDELQLDGSGRKITLGDGGLFVRPPIPIAYTDFYYASSQSKWAFVNTQYGSIYPSQRQGRVFQYTGQLNEISNSGVSWWFKNNLPSYLLKDFPDYRQFDNPVAGIGLSTVFDNTNEIVYLSKKDYRLRDAFKGKVTYNNAQDRFEFNTREIQLTDTGYFEDASWTISYDPKQKFFISWHDWHPSWMIQSETHFLTVKDKTIWKHNDRCDSFCNFYGVQHPFEIELVVNFGQNVNILRSVEYFMEAGKYFTGCRDFHTILDANFDHAVISNHEQASGMLQMNIQSKKNMTDLLDYPRYDAVNEQIKILFNKEEQRYRFNQFSDIVKDRGEFSGKNYPIWISDVNGYVRTLNTPALDYFKPVQHRKKFRNNWHRIWLSKSNPADIKYILKFVNSKTLYSPR